MENCAGVRRWAALKASGFHFLLSLAVAAVASYFVFFIWYPFPYAYLSGGRELFWLVSSVDVVCGPLLTLVVFNPNKQRKELLQDLIIIACLQLAALGYGVWTVAQARPVHLVFEVDRFRVVSAADVDRSQLPLAPYGLRQLPWSGPTTIGSRRAQSSDEVFQGIENAIHGIEISMSPSRWVPYDQVRNEVLQRAVPLPTLAARKPEAKALLETGALRAGVPASSARFLPVMSRFASWTVLVNEHGDPTVFLPVDIF